MYNMNHIYLTKSIVLTAKIIVEIATNDNKLQPGVNPGHIILPTINFSQFAKRTEPEPYKTAG